MLIGYMRVSSESDRQTTILQRDALMAFGVDSRHLFEDHASGAKDDRPGLKEALVFVRPGDVLVVWNWQHVLPPVDPLAAESQVMKGRPVRILFDAWFMRVIGQARCDTALFLPPVVLVKPGRGRPKK